MNNDISYIQTTDNLTVYFDGRPHTVPLTDPRVEDVQTALRAGDLQRLRTLLDFKQTISDVSENRVKFDRVTRSLTFNDKPLHNAIMERLITLFDQNMPINGHLRFLDRLMDNPSYRAVNEPELYRFIEACDLPITSDGYFLAYKIVRNDYTDCYSGKFDNSLGATPRVERNQVDEDSNRTCSHGLHACSHEYLPHYGGSKGRIMVVKIDPADVVAVPQDYNNAKLRCCGYEVVDEIPRDEALDGKGMDSYHTDDHGFADVQVFEDDYDELDDHFDFGDDPEDEEDEQPVVASKPVVNGKLTEHQVNDIDRLLNDGELSIVAIGKLYDVNESTIRKIRDGLIWSSVTGR